MAVTSIRNETPSRLTLRNIDGAEMVLAPLQEKEIAEHTGFFFEDLEREGLVSQRREAPSSVGEQLSTVLLGGGFWVVIIALILSKNDPWFGIERRYWPAAVWGAGVFLLVAAAATLFIRSTNSFALVVRWTMQALALTVILSIGLGLPAATIYFFGGGQGLLAGTSLALFGRLVQLAFIGTASLLPVLLFFLFDRYQLSTMRNRLYASLFRLDRSVSTVGEIDAKYGSQIREAYGPDAQGRGRLTPGTRWPVLVCSFVITIGWIIALAPVGGGFAPADATDVLKGLLPQRSATVFGFLGVYFFSLRLIARRYARGDLKPKAYTQIMVRVFVVAVLSWVLEAIFTGEPASMRVLAFLFGITPDEFFTWLREFTRGLVPERIIPQQPLPLTELEGIDIYDLGRLQSEGIANIEGLAHHELMDLIIETRLPVPRLVDWLDQAILYLHIADASGDKARTSLRKYGIRTATDLLRAWDEAARRGGDFAEFKKALLEDSQAPYRLEVIRDALLDDEWMDVIRYWRADDARAPIERDAVPSSVEELERIADEELAKERYSRAVGFLKRALQIQDTSDTRRKLASILATARGVDERDPDGAREHATRAFELAPDNIDGLVELARIHLALEDKAMATQMHDRALALVDALPNSMRKQKDQERKRLENLQEQIDALLA